MDDLDKKIVNLLVDNSKLSYRKIAERTGVSVATVMNRVNALEKSGILQKYTAKVDYEKAGYDVSVIVDIRVSKGKLIEVHENWMI